MKGNRFLSTKYKYFLVATSPAHLNCQNAPRTWLSNGGNYIDYLCSHTPNGALQKLLNPSFLRPSSAYGCLRWSFQTSGMHGPTSSPSSDPTAPLPESWRILCRRRISLPFLLPTSRTSQTTILSGVSGCIKGSSEFSLEDQNGDAGCHPCR